MSNKKDLWVAGITRGHNGGTCLLKNGEIIFAIEEERLSRQKYDGGPFASMIKILNYTDHIDYLAVAHTHSLFAVDAPKIDFTGDDIYTALSRKIGLINRKANLFEHPQIIDCSEFHHKLHASCAFFRSGFDKAVAIVVDGAGTLSRFSANGEDFIGWETETIYTCEYPNKIQTLYKHVGSRGPHVCEKIIEKDNQTDNESYPVYVTDRGGIVKAYEAVTEYCGFPAIEAGKTMGLFPYGKENANIPPLFDYSLEIPLTNRNLIIPTYPNSAKVNDKLIPELSDNDCSELSYLQNRRDMAYACQIQTQKEVAKLIRKAVELSGINKVVLTGGYGLNCVANYYYLEELKDLDIDLYVEPISSDAGTAIGAAYFVYQSLSKNTTIYPRQDTLYLGLNHNYSVNYIKKQAEDLEVKYTTTSKDKIIDLIIEQNIVAIFQGKSESGPRALGNRSILYDPRIENGKEIVNRVKRREYFRPFAGTILEEDVHDWFDLRGMKNSPSMMYAVNCKEGVADKIPSIIHVDGTCRIQTINQKQNPDYYELIKLFKERTNIPILFNTSFNLGGEPLVETIEDAIWTLKTSFIEYLYLPEYELLITDLNE